MLQQCFLTPLRDTRGERRSVLPRPSGSHSNRHAIESCWTLVHQVDNERYPRIEPVTMQLLDLRARREPAQMNVALAVVEQVDRLAQRVSCLCQLCRLL